MFWFTCWSGELCLVGRYYWIMSGEWWQSGDKELCAAMVEIQARMRRDYAALLEIVSEAENRGVAKSTGCGSLPQLLTDVLRIRPSEAKRCVEQAVAVMPNRMITGGELSPALPATGEAAREGALDRDHVATIHKHVAALPGWLSAEQRATFETALVEQAHIGHAGAVDRFATELRARLDQDGAPPRDERWVRPRNEVTYAVRSDGRTVGRFDLDAEAGALFRAVIDPLAKPAPAEDGVPDERTAGERQGDGFVDLVRLAAASDDMPSQGEAKPQVTVTVPLSVLEKGLGSALVTG